MPTLLHVDVSPRGDHSVSRQLGKEFVNKWREQHAGERVIHRDLTKTSLPFVDLPWIAGAFSAPEQHSEEHKAALKISDELIGELQAADQYLISTPMYNFTVPAALKAWIDHIVRAGITFRLSPSGPVGLLTGKRATVVVASGSLYGAGTPFESYNFETPYLKGILGFIGITDIHFVMAGGTNQLASGQVGLDDFLKPYAGQIEAAVQ